MDRKQKQDQKTHEKCRHSVLTFSGPNDITVFLLFQAPMTSQCSRMMRIWWIYQQNWSLGTALRSVSVLLRVRQAWQDQRIKPLYLRLNLQCFQFSLAVEWAPKTIAPAVICLRSWAATVQIRLSTIMVRSQTQRDSGTQTAVEKV